MEGCVDGRVHGAKVRRERTGSDYYVVHERLDGGRLGRKRKRGGADAEE